MIIKSALTIHKVIYVQNLLVYLLEHCNNRVLNQRLDKVFLDTTGTSPAETSKYIKQDFLNLSLPTGCNRDQDLKIRNSTTQ